MGTQRQRIMIALAVLAFLTVADLPEAGAISLINATWSYTVNGQGYTDQVFTGLASFTFDDSVLTGVGNENFDNIPLLSFSQTPATIGATLFDLSNTVGRLGFFDGVVWVAAIGGAPSGASSLTSNQDDFTVTQQLPGSVGVGLSVGSESGFAAISNTSSNFTITAVPETAVPEPSTLTLLAIGTFGMIGVCVRKRKQPA